MPPTLERNVAGNLLAAGVRAAEAYRQAVRVEAELLLTASKLEVPVDTGNLMGSGFIEERGDTTVVGYQAEYAVFVHEDMNARHRRGKAKFLEDPLKAALPGMPQRIADRVEEALGGRSAGKRGGKRGRMAKRAAKRAAKAARRAAKRGARVAKRGAKVTRKAARKAGRVTKRVAKRAARGGARAVRGGTKRLRKMLRRVRGKRRR